MKDTSSPYFRINAYSYGDIYATGTPENLCYRVKGKILLCFILRR